MADDSELGIGERSIFENPVTIYTTDVAEKLQEVAEVSKQLHNNPALQNIANNVTVQNLNKFHTIAISNAGKVVIPELLNQEQQMKLSKVYGTHNLHYTNSVPNSHAMAAAARRCELVHLYTKVGYKIGYEYTAPYLTDIGGNFATGFTHDYKGIHYCSPVIDNIDSNRKTNRFNVVNNFLRHNPNLTPNQTLNIKDILSVFRSTSTSSPFVCRNLVQHCSVPSDYGIALHSLYNIAPRELADAMVKKKMITVVGCMMWDPNILFAKQGEIPDLDVIWEIIDNKQGKKVIRFSFKKDFSIAYEHLLSNYIAWFICSQITSSKGHRFVIEKLEMILGVQYIRVNAIDNDASIKEVPINIKCWTNLENMLVIRWPVHYVDLKLPGVKKSIKLQYEKMKKQVPAWAVKYNHSEIPSFNTSKDYDFIMEDQRATSKLNCNEIAFLVDKEMVYAVLEYIQNAQEKKFTQPETYSYARSKCHAIMVGKEIIVKGEWMDPRLLFVLSQVLYTYCYVLKYNHGKNMQSVLGEIAKNRRMAEVGIFKKFYLKFIKGGIGRCFPKATKWVNDVAYHMWKNESVCLYNMIRSADAYIEFCDDKLSSGVDCFLDCWKNDHHNMLIVPPVLRLQDDLMENVLNNLIPQSKKLVADVNSVELVKYDHYVSNFNKIVSLDVIINVMYVCGKEGTRKEKKFLRAFLKGVSKFTVEYTYVNIVNAFVELVLKTFRVVELLLENSNGLLYMHVTISKDLNKPILGRSDYYKIIKPMVCNHLVNNTVSNRIRVCEQNQGMGLDPIPLVADIRTLKTHKILSSVVNESVYSNAFIKLRQMDAQFDYKLIKLLRNTTVLDIGSGPGTWSEYVVETNSDLLDGSDTSCKIISCSLPNNGKMTDIYEHPCRTKFEDLRSNFTLADEEEVESYIKYVTEHQSEKGVELVLSDTGVDGADPDQEGTFLPLLKNIIKIILRTIAVGGRAVVKCYIGEKLETLQLIYFFSKFFKQSYLIKPKNSNIANGEIYFVGTDYFRAGYVFENKHFDALSSVYRIGMENFVMAFNLRRVNYMEKNILIELPKNRNFTDSGSSQSSVVSKKPCFKPTAPVAVFGYIKPVESSLIVPEPELQYQQKVITYLDSMNTCGNSGMTKLTVNKDVRRSLMEIIVENDKDKIKKRKNPVIGKYKVMPGPVRKIKKLIIKKTMNGPMNVTYKKVKNRYAKLKSKFTALYNRVMKKFLHVREQKVVAKGGEERYDINNFSVSTLSLNTTVFEGEGESEFVVPHNQIPVKPLRKSQRSSLRSLNKNSSSKSSGLYSVDLDVEAYSELDTKSWTTESVYTSMSGVSTEDVFEKVTKELKYELGDLDEVVSETANDGSLMAVSEVSEVLYTEAIQNPSNENPEVSISFTGPQKPPRRKKNQLKKCNSLPNEMSKPEFSEQKRTMSEGYVNEENHELSTDSSSIETVITVTVGDVLEKPVIAIEREMESLELHENPAIESDEPASLPYQNFKTRLIELDNNTLKFQSSLKVPVLREVSTPADGQCLYHSLTMCTISPAILKNELKLFYPLSKSYQNHKTTTRELIMETLSSDVWGISDIIDIFCEKYRICVVEIVRNEEMVVIVHGERHFPNHYIYYRNDHYSAAVPSSSKFFGPLTVEMSRVKLLNVELPYYVPFHLTRFSEGEELIVHFQTLKYLPENKITSVKLQSGTYPFVKVTCGPSNNPSGVQYVNAINLHISTCVNCQFGEKKRWYHYNIIPSLMFSCGRTATVEMAENVDFAEVLLEPYVTPTPVISVHLAYQKEGNVIKLAYPFPHENQDFTDAIVHRTLEKAGVLHKSTVGVRTAVNINYSHFYNALTKLFDTVYYLPVTIVDTAGRDFNFSPKLEVSKEAVMTNAALELRETYRVSTDVVLRNCKEFFDSLLYQINTSSNFSFSDNSVGVFSVQAGLWIKPSNEKCNYVYGYDERLKKGDLYYAKELYSNDVKILTQLKNKFPNIRFFITYRALKLLLEPTFYKTLRPYLVIEEIFRDVDVEIVRGVPGAGKTFHILSKHHITNDLSELVLTATKDAAADLRNRVQNMIKNAGKEPLSAEILRRKYATVESAYMNSQYYYSSCEVIYFDEAFLKHLGSCIWATLILKPKKVVFVGDESQVPYSDRNNCPIAYASIKKLMPFVPESSLTFLSVSRRVPRDVCTLINEFLRFAGQRMYEKLLRTSNTVERSITAVQISGSDYMSPSTHDQWLTFTQDEKLELSKKNFKVNTIHEFQGQQAASIGIVRVKATNTTIYDDSRYLLTAFSRHTNVCVYYSVVVDETFNMIQRLEKTPVPEAVRQAGGYVYNSAHKMTAEENRINMRLNGVDLSPEKELILVPEYGMNLSNEDPTLVEIVLSNGGSGYRGHHIVAVDKPFVRKERFEPLLDRLNHDNINLLQYYMDLLRPDSTMMPKRHLMDLFEHTDLVINSRMFALGPIKSIPERRDSLTPALRTPCPMKFFSSQKAYLKAYNERNGAIETVETALFCKDVLDTAIKNFSYCYFKINAEELLKTFRSSPITVNVDSLTKWFNTQPPGVFAEVQGLDSKFLIYHLTNKYSYMLKALAKPKLESNPHTDFSSPQAIAFLPKIVNVVFCPIVQELKRRIQFLLKPNKILFTDMSIEVFEDLLSDRVSPELLSKIRTKFEIDFSKYDRSQRLHTLEFECAIMRAFGIPDELIEFWMVTHKVSQLIAYDVRFKAVVEYQRKSGDAMTFLGNTLWLMYVIMSLVGHEELKSAFCMFGGDDSLIFFDKITDIDQSTVHRQSTALFNMEIKIIKTKAFYFCSRFIIFSELDDRWYVVPDPLKALIKLGRNDLVNYKHVTEYMISLRDNWKNFGNVLLHDIIAYNFADRYQTPHHIGLLLSAMYNLVNNEDEFKKLYYWDDADEEPKVTTLPSLDI